MPENEKWLFTKSELVVSSPSRDDGLSYEEECSMRRKACKFAVDMSIELRNSVRDSVRTDPNIAVLLIHRFFTRGSFMNFEFCDVAAVCLYMSEDSFQEYFIRSIVHGLESMRESNKNEDYFGANYVRDVEWFRYQRDRVQQYIENSTGIEIPQICMERYREIIGKSSTEAEIVWVAHGMVLEVLCITDWSIRYPNATIAAACIHISSYFSDMSIDENNVNGPWYQAVDKSIEKKTLDYMLNEFIELFRDPSNRFGSLIVLDPKEKVKAVAPTVTPKSPTMKKMEEAIESQRYVLRYESYGSDIGYAGMNYLDETSESESNCEHSKKDQKAEPTFHSDHYSSLTKLSDFCHNSDSNTWSPELVYLGDKNNQKESKRSDNYSTSSTGTFPERHNFRSRRSGLKHDSNSQSSTSSSFHDVEPSNKRSRRSNNYRDSSKLSDTSRITPRFSFQHDRSRTRSPCSSEDDEPTHRGYSRRFANDRHSSRKAYQRGSGYKDSHSNVSYDKRKY